MSETGGHVFSIVTDRCELCGAGVNAFLDNVSPTCTGSIVGETIRQTMTRQERLGTRVSYPEPQGLTALTAEWMKAMSERAWKDQPFGMKNGEIITNEMAYKRPDEWFEASVRDWHPTEADIAHMAMFMKCAYHDVPFGHAPEPRDPRWQRVATLTFEHPGYVPSIAQERRRNVEAMNEVEKCAEVRIRGAEDRARITLGHFKSALAEREEARAELKAVVDRDVELVGHGELAALKERDAAVGLVNDGLTAMASMKDEIAALRAERDLFAESNRWLRGDHVKVCAELNRAHDLLAQFTAANAPVPDPPSPNPFRTFDNDPRRMGPVLPREG